MKLYKNYDIHPANYDKPTPRLLKRIADFLLATILVVNPLIFSIPDFQGKEWIIWSWNVFIILFKFATKTVTKK